MQMRISYNEFSRGIFRPTLKYLRSIENRDFVTQSTTDSYLECSEHDNRQKNENRISTKRKFVCFVVDDVVNVEPQMQLFNHFLFEYLRHNGTNILRSIYFGFAFFLCGFSFCFSLKFLVSSLNFHFTFSYNCLTNVILNAFQPPTAFAIF